MTLHLNWSVQTSCIYITMINEICSICTPSQAISQTAGYLLEREPQKND